MDWLNLGAVIAGVALLVAWYKADNAPTPDARRPWLIVRYGAIGFIVMWLIVEGPTLWDLLFNEGLSQQ